MTAPTPEEVMHDLHVGFPDTRRSALIQEAIDTLAAVTAERDQARQMLADADEKWHFEHALYEDAILQRDAARERISNAPHDDLCAVWEISGGESDAGCTCWKAGL